MKAGKALNERKVEIRVQFKPPAAGIHGHSLNEMRNELVVRPFALAVSDAGRNAHLWHPVYANTWRNG